MKKVIPILALVVLLAAAASVQAGRWGVTGHVTNVSPMRGGHAVHKAIPPSHLPTCPPYRPGYGPRPYYGSGLTVTYGSDCGWSVGYSTGYGYPYRPYRPYYPVYVSPYPYGYSYGYGVTTIVTAPVYVVDDGIRLRGAAAAPAAPGGVFMVPMNAAPNAQGVNMAALNAPDIRARIAGEAEESYSAAPDTALERNLARVAKTFRRGDYSRADKDLRGLMRQNPSDPTVSYTYAYVFFMEEKYVAAALVLRRAIDLKGDMASVTKSLLGEFYDADQTADALKKLDKRLEAKADDSDARIVRAWMRLAEGRLEDAKSDVQVLLKDDKDDAEAAHILSLCTP